jgi:hypothetical protein
LFITNLPSTAYRYGASPAKPGSQKWGTKEFFFCHEIDTSWKAEHKKKGIGEINVIGYQNKGAGRWYIFSSFDFPGEKNIEHWFAYSG